MVFFITFLRALAACIITNAHYTGIYPTDIIANGGLIGDVLFFAVSGYCLYNVKYDLSLSGFVRWYGKRLWRVYPPVLIITAVYMMAGAYSLKEHGAFWWYVYPTNYHFVASIITLYIPFFFIAKIPALRERITTVMIVVAGVYLLIYWTVYDRSYYHIDTVREPMIRFLFMESMLLGAWFRRNDKELRNMFKPIHLCLAIVSFAIYFAGKILFSRMESIAAWQVMNQVTLFVLLCFLFRTFCGIDGKLEDMPIYLKEIIVFISGMTLEIYIVQYVIIDYIRAKNIFFPANWLILTASIIIAAFILHKICELMYKNVDRVLGKVKK